MSKNLKWIKTFEIFNINEFFNYEISVDKKLTIEDIYHIIKTLSGKYLFGGKISIQIFSSRGKQIDFAIFYNKNNPFSYTYKKEDTLDIRGSISYGVDKEYEKKQELAWEYLKNNNIPVKSITFTDKLKYSLHGDEKEIFSFIEKFKKTLLKEYNKHVFKSDYTRTFGENEFDGDKLIDELGL